MAAVDRGWVLSVNHCPRCQRVLFVDRRNGDAWCKDHGTITIAPATEGIIPRDPHNPWTPEHEAFALANQDRLSCGEIAVALGRTKKAVKHWFARHKIRKPRVTSQRRYTPKTPPAERRAYRHWSNEEIEALEDGEVKILSRARTRMAIHVRASRLGQPIRSGDGCLSARQAAATYSIRPTTITQWAERGLLPAHRRGQLWRIDPIDAERHIPRLARQAQANNGRKSWWTKAE